MQVSTRRIAQIIAALGAGAGVSAMVWVLGADLGWLILIGIIFAFRKSLAAAAIFGYWMVAGWVFPGVFVNFFHVSALIGIGVDGAVAALAALAAWVSVWTARKVLKAVRIFNPGVLTGALACVLFFVLSVLPPLGAVLNSSPLLAAASIAPGMGLWALAITVTAMMILAEIPALLVGRKSGMPLFSLSLITLVTLEAIGGHSLAAHAGVPSQADYRLEVLRPPPQIRGVGEGAFLDAFAAEALTREVNQHIAKNRGSAPHLVLLAPEGALPRYRAASALVLARLAGNLPLGVSVILGTFANASCAQAKFSTSCVNGVSNSSLDAVVILRSHYLGLIGARIPAPIGEWKPWAKRSVRAHWFTGASERITLTGGTHAAVLVCFEQWLIWPAMRAALDGPFQVVLAPSSHLWPHAGAVIALQRRLAQAEARIYGARLLYADAVLTNSRKSR